MTIAADTEINLPSKFYGEKTVIISKSGFGKSYTARVIIEDGIKTGQSFVILDPQDAYLNMPEFEYIPAENVKSPKALGVLISQSNRNIVIQLRKLSIEKQNDFVKDFLTEYRKTARKGIQTIVMDEAHKFAPEMQKTAAKEITRGMAQEDRSYGIGFIAITQRISRLDKTILSQADNIAIGRVTSNVDKKAVDNYLDNKEDIDKIAKLERGEFYLYGFGYDDPRIVKIRKSKTKHSGDSPENVLKQNKEIFDIYKAKIVKNKHKGDTMSDDISTQKETVKKVIPSMTGFKDLAMLGAKVSLGSAVGGIAGSMIGARFRSPIPVISSRTLGSGASTVALYAGYRMIGSNLVSDVMKYSAAGSAAFTLGSMAYDFLGVMNVQLPNLANMGLATATGIPQPSPDEMKGVDVDTQFA
jgi:hypothetical protein